jgi:hypothetical protein
MMIFIDVEVSRTAPFFVIVIRLRQPIALQAASNRRLDANP